MDNKMIKVIIADDHEIILDGLISLIKPEADIEVVGQATNGNQVKPLLTQHSVDLAILDIEMPELDGIDLTRHIRNHHPSVKVLILSMHSELRFIKKCIEAGSNGYILKNKGKEELVTAIREIAKGNDYFGEEVNKTLISSHRTQKTFNEIRLTKREKEVLYLIANGSTTPIISKELRIGHSTVETHRRNLIDKTGAGNTKGLVKYGVENGFC